MTDLASIAPRLAEQAIELPSWAFGYSGTRSRCSARPLYVMRDRDTKATENDD
jgi:L-rhamnose isomerase